MLATANETPAKAGPPVPPELTGNALEGMAEDLVSEPILTSADHPKAASGLPVVKGGATGCKAE